MNVSDQSILEQIHNLTGQIEASQHRHISEALQREMEKNGMNQPPALSMLEYHAIAYIGDKDITNAVSIAKHLNITRGGISKINQRLINKGLIERRELEGNKREVFYKLTSSGGNVYKMHQFLHKKAEFSLLEKINKYSRDEKEIIRRFLGDLMESI